MRDINTHIDPGFFPFYILDRDREREEEIQEGCTRWLRMPRCSRGLDRATSWKTR